MKNSNEHLYKLKQEFLDHWPLEKLQNMTLEEYTDTKRDNSFCYWLEHKTRDLGSIVGGSSYKFGIYKMGTTSKTEAATNRDNDGVYAWHTKYGGIAIDAFNTIKLLIVKVASLAIQNNLNPIEQIDLGDAYKWKIAFLYSDFKVINIFKKEALYFIVNAKLNNEVLPKQYGDLNGLILSKNRGQEYFSYTRELWQDYYKYNSKAVEFKKWLDNVNKGKSNKSNSYISAIKILISDFNIDVYTETNINALNDLYEDLIENQRDPNGKYAHVKKSYGEKGFYSASIKSYIEFLTSESDPVVYESDSSYKHQQKGISMKKQPLNQIFYGPPGTGKTYNTILEAAEIIKQNDDIEYGEALGVFNDNLGEQIEFVTFHQNYSYEDFIQGLRPDTELSGELSFFKNDGVFKRIADKALKNLKASKNPEIANKEFIEVFGEFIKPLNDEVLEEIEVQMKKNSFYITEVGEKSIQFRKANGESKHSLSIATLQKMYDNGVNDIILGGLQPYYNPLLAVLLENGKSNNTIVERKNYVIIIDEINRANISRVFGELITLIEKDKRSEGKIPLTATLPSGDKFIVPSNLYIIGTMNTADKSIALLDIALRRRFEFIPMYPQYKIEDNEIYDVEKLETINKEIISRKGHDFTIGHSYFMGDDYDFKNTINNKVIPLLLEYFMNDVEEVKNILKSANIEIDGWPLQYKAND